MVETAVAMSKAGERTVSVHSNRLIASVHLSDEGAHAAGDGAPALSCPSAGSGPQTCHAGDGGGVVATITVDEPQASAYVLRLNGPERALRWRVRVQPDEVALSQHESGTPRWAIERKARARVIDPHGKTIGTLKIDAAKSLTIASGGGKRFTVDGAPGSVAGGLFLIAPMPPVDRLLLLAALVERGI
jgi:hypothetical protein